MTKKRDPILLFESQAQKPCDFNYLDIRLLKLEHKRQLAGELIKKHKLEVEQQREAPLSVQEYDPRLLELCLKEYKKKSFSCKL